LFFTADNSFADAFALYSINKSFENLSWRMALKSLNLVLKSMENGYWKVWKMVI